MNCESCGKPVDDGARFCQTCGAALDAPEETRKRVWPFFVPNLAFVVLAALIAFPFGSVLVFFVVAPFSTAGIFFGASAAVDVSDGDLRGAECPACAAKILFWLNFFYFPLVVFLGSLAAMPFD